MLTVNHSEYREAYNELREFERRYDDIVSFSNLSGTFGDESIKIGVNWASIGAVSPDKALKFAEVIKQAVELAENFKYNGYMIEYGC